MALAATTIAYHVSRIMHARSEASHTDPVSTPDSSTRTTHDWDL